MAGQVTYNKAPPRYEADLLKTGTAASANGGDAVPLSVTPVGCIEIAIQPLPANVGEVWIGGVDVEADGTAGGLMLIPTTPGAQPATLSISAQNLAQVYINPVEDDEGVTFIYW